MEKPEKPRKPNEPLPYYRWYWRDWRGSRAVQRMTPLERGLYRELLDEQWRLGAIRADIPSLAEAAMCSEEEMANAWRTLSKCFSDVPGSDGAYVFNERMEAERTEHDTKRTKAAIAGKLGANAKHSSGERYIAVAEQSESRSSAAPRANGAAGPEGPHPIARSAEEWRRLLDLPLTDRTRVKPQ
jgi:hypothetical protein